jgi:hypothetical protein
MTKRTAIAIAALVLAASAAGAADSFFSSHLSRPGGVVPCYARTYDAKHLAAHPEQRVVHFYLTHSPADHGTPPRTFDVSFGFTLRGGEDWYAGEAGCAAKGDGAECTGEGDVGEFTLVPRNEGLLVEIGRMETVETGADLAASDDREFRLYESPEGECFYEGSGEEEEPVTDPNAPGLSRPG